jgi:hypothetical protein
MTITALPTPPSTSDPVNFSAATDAFLGALPLLVTEVNAAAAAMNMNSTTDTSNTSNVIGTGAKTFTVSAGKSFLGGMYLVIADTAAPSTNSMYGQVTSYIGTSLVVNILSITGSGTKTAWVISQCSPNSDVVNLIHGAPNKATPVGADEFGIWNSITGLLNKVTFTSLVSYLSGLCNSGWNASTATLATTANTALMRSYLAGLGMSTAGSSATIGIAAGQAVDSTNAAMMLLGSAYTKTTLAWAVGTANGGKLSAAAIANNTWYYWYLIRRPDTGVVDIGFDVSSSAPTLPANYTQYRYIGAAKTDGSAQWTAFTQFGRKFMWSVPVLDSSSAASGTAALVTCTVPLGRKMEAFFNANGGSGGSAIYISDPANADSAPSTSAAPLASQTGYPTVTGAGYAGSVFTNSSGQVRIRCVSPAGTAYLVTLGWIDLADTNI